MCSIFLTTRSLTNVDDIPAVDLLRRRGPDRASMLNIDDICMTHFLLSVTGDFVQQPLVYENIACCFNGELYNELPQGQTEIGYIIEQYLVKGADFVTSLDGEFAIVLFDLKRRELLISTDTFGTKPLYYIRDSEHLSVSSYAEPIELLHTTQAVRCQPNETLIFNLDAKKIIHKQSVTQFCLQQTKTHFDDWEAAFLQSLKKRFTHLNYELILPLSSGHDSGAIACGLELLGVDFISYSYEGQEHLPILNARLERVTSPQTAYKYSFNKLTSDHRRSACEFIRSHCADFYYGPDLDPNNYVKNGSDDPGAQALAHLLTEVKQAHPRIKVMASGQGGDEIMGNYGKYTFGQPNPGSFPDDLNDVFPWQNFFLGAQSSYLIRDESVSGGHGIEGRYPLLDKGLVQEFLWLSPRLKNSEYKSPLSKFMEKYAYPYAKGEAASVKKGFNA